MEASLLDNFLKSFIEIIYISKDSPILNVQFHGF